LIYIKHPIVYIYEGRGLLAK